MFPCTIEGKKTSISGSNKNFEKEKDMSNRVISRKGARELTVDEVTAVSGGTLKSFGTKTGSGKNDVLIVED
jgi:hypothetical protein